MDTDLEVCHKCNRHRPPAALDESKACTDQISCLNSQNETIRTDILKITADLAPVGKGKGKTLSGAINCTGSIAIKSEINLKEVNVGKVNISDNTNKRMGLGHHHQNRYGSSTDGQRLVQEIGIAGSDRLFFVFRASAYDATAERLQHSVIQKYLHRQNANKLPYSRCLHCQRHDLNNEGYLYLVTGRHPEGTLNRYNYVPLEICGPTHMHASCTSGSNLNSPMSQGLSGTTSYGCNMGFMGHYTWANRHPLLKADTQDDDRITMGLPDTTYDMCICCQEPEKPTAYSKFCTLACASGKCGEDETNPHLHRSYVGVVTTTTWTYLPGQASGSSIYILLAGDQWGVLTNGGGFADDAFLTSLNKTGYAKLTQAELLRVLEKARTVLKRDTSDEDHRAAAAREVTEEMNLEVKEANFEFLRRHQIPAALRLLKTYHYKVPPADLQTYDSEGPPGDPGYNWHAEGEIHEITPFLLYILSEYTRPTRSKTHIWVNLDGVDLAIQLGCLKDHTYHGLKDFYKMHNRQFPQNDMDMGPHYSKDQSKLKARQSVYNVSQAYMMPHSTRVVHNKHLMRGGAERSGQEEHMEREGSKDGDGWGGNNQLTKQQPSYGNAVGDPIILPAIESPYDDPADMTGFRDKTLTDFSLLERRTGDNIWSVRGTDVTLCMGEPGCYLIAERGDTNSELAFSREIIPYLLAYSTNFRDMPRNTLLRIKTSQNFDDYSVGDLRSYGTLMQQHVTLPEYDCHAVREIIEHLTGLRYPRKESPRPAQRTFTKNCNYTGPTRLEDLATTRTDLEYPPGALITKHYMILVHGENIHPNDTKLTLVTGRHDDGDLTLPGDRDGDGHKEDLNTQMAHLSKVCSTFFHHDIRLPETIEPTDQRITKIPPYTLHGHYVRTVYTFFVTDNKDHPFKQPWVASDGGSWATLTTPHLRHVMSRTAEQIQDAEKYHSAPSSALLALFIPHRQLPDDVLFPIGRRATIEEIKEYYGPRDFTPALISINFKRAGENKEPTREIMPQRSRFLRTLPSTLDDGALNRDAAAYYMPGKNNELGRHLMKEGFYALKTDYLGTGYYAQQPCNLLEAHHGRRTSLLETLQRQAAQQKQLDDVKETLRELSTETRDGNPDAVRNTRRRIGQGATPYSQTITTERANCIWCMIRNHANQFTQYCITVKDSPSCKDVESCRQRTALNFFTNTRSVTEVVKCGLCLRYCPADDCTARPDLARGGAIPHICHDEAKCDDTFRERMVLHFYNKERYIRNLRRYMRHKLRMEAIAHNGENENICDKCLYQGPTESMGRPDDAKEHWRCTEPCTHADLTREDLLYNNRCRLATTTDGRVMHKDTKRLCILCGFYQLTPDMELHSDYKAFICSPTNRSECNRRRCTFLISYDSRFSDIGNEPLSENVDDTHRTTDQTTEIDRLLLKLQYETHLIPPPPERPAPAGPLTRPTGSFNHIHGTCTYCGCQGRVLMQHANHKGVFHCADMSKCEDERVAQAPTTTHMAILPLPLNLAHCAKCATYLDIKYLHVYSDDHGKNYICKPHRPGSHGNCYTRKATVANYGQPADVYMNPIYHACSYCATNTMRIKHHACSEHHDSENLWHCEPTKFCPDPDITKGEIGVIPSLPLEVLHCQFCHFHTTQKNLILKDDHHHCVNQAECSHRRRQRWHKMLEERNKVTADGTANM